MQALRETRPLYPVFAILLVTLALGLTDRPLLAALLPLPALAMALPWWLARPVPPAPR